MCWGWKWCCPTARWSTSAAKTLGRARLRPGAACSSARRARSGIATKITLRIVERPEAVQTLLAAFHSTDDAGEAVSRIIAAGILPAAIEMMDRLSIQAAEAAVHAGYPDCEGLLLVELDGPAAEVDALMAQVEDICTRVRGVGDCGWPSRRPSGPSFWKGRKAAFAAMGRISPNYIVQDGVIPRTALPQRPARDRAR